MTNGNDAAYGHGAVNGHCCGLTKREYFAAMAMQGFCAADAKLERENKTIAHWSVNIADELIDALNEERK